MIGITSLVLAVSIAWPSAPASEPKRIELGEAVLVLPAGYRPLNDRADVILHLHGAVSVVEKALAESGWQGPLLVFNRKGLSSVYAEPFRDRSLFPRLLDKARGHRHGVARGRSPDRSRVCQLVQRGFRRRAGTARDPRALRAD